MSGEEGRCGAEKSDGESCPSSIALCPNCQRCRAHCLYAADCRYDEKEVQASRARGGKRGKNKKIRTVEDDSAPPPPESLEDAVQWASWATWAVATGRIDGKTAHEIGYLVRAYMKGLQDTEELSDRVEKLEEALDERNWGPGA